MKYLAFFLTVLGIQTIGWAQNEITDDYAVYSEVLAEFLDETPGIDTLSCLVVKPKFTYNNLALDTYDGTEPLAYFYRFHPELVATDKHNKAQVDTAFIRLCQQFEAYKDSTTQAVKNRFRTRFQIQIIPHWKLSYFFADELSGWKKFYKTYPKAFGLLELSKIAYSADKKRCLFYLGYQRQALWGAGYLLYINLEKTENKIIRSVKLWVSM